LRPFSNVATPATSSSTTACLRFWVAAQSISGVPARTPKSPAVATVR